MSTLIIAPSNAPSKIEFVVPIFAKNPLIALLIVVNTGDITKIIPKDVNNNPNTGKISIGLVPSSDFGRFLVIFFKNKIT